jgi:hypothetical protein
MAYRDEDAWIHRREGLVHALVSEPDLDARERIAAELDRFDRERRAEARRRLPVIASARIASPCPESFEAMIGEGAIRSCARCDQQVFDVARMTLAQAEALIATRGNACVRLTRRADGAMMFADCEVGARGVRARRVGGVIAAAVIAGTAVATALAPWPTPLYHVRHSLAPASRPAVGVHYVHQPAPLTPDSLSVHTYEMGGLVGPVSRIDTPPVRLPRVGS